VRCRLLAPGSFRPPAAGRVRRPTPDRARPSPHAGRGCTAPGGVRRCGHPSSLGQWDAPGNMLDGNSDTRYSSGTGQYDGLWIHCRRHPARVSDHARSADVYVSTDGTDWTKVTAVADGQRVHLISFPTQTARYIKVVNSGNVARSWWSVAEFPRRRGSASCRREQGVLMSLWPWTRHFPGARGDFRPAAHRVRASATRSRSACQTSTGPRRVRRTHRGRG
jgi:hypothetical protein